MLITDPSTIQELRANGVDVYDYSSIARSISCPRSYDYRHERGLMLAVEPTANYALEFGRCIHKALKYWYPNRKADEAILLFATEFKPFEEKPTLSGKTGKELDATYTVRFGCSLLDAYFTKYGNENYTLIQNEVPIAEELADNIFVAGILDKVVKRNGSKTVFIDHKTSKYMDKYTVNPNPQFMGYKFLTEKLTGEHVSGELDMLGVAKSKDLVTLLRREPFDYTPYQMSQWRASIIEQITLIRRWRESKFFPQYWNCKPFFRDCQFLPLCTLARKEEEPGLIANLYKISYWDPFTVEN
jgi:hypothetical protein